jgi:hypothetical protein
VDDDRDEQPDDLLALLVGESAFQASTHIGEEVDGLRRHRLLRPGRQTSQACLDLLALARQASELGTKLSGRLKALLG